MWQESPHSVREIIGQNDILFYNVCLCSFRYENYVSFPFFLPLMSINYVQIFHLIEMKNSAYIIRVSKVDFTS